MPDTLLPLPSPTPALWVRDHAAERWAERVRLDPLMPLQAARANLLACAASGTWSATAPAWMAVDEGDDALYLLVADAVIVVRRDSGRYVAVTTMTPHDRDSVHGARLRQARRARQRRRRAICS